MRGEDKETAPSDAVAGVLFNPIGTAADGAVGVRSPIPLVRRDRGRCCSVGPFGFLKEPRPAARRGYRRKVPGGGSESAAGKEAPIHRALHGRRDADRSGGFVEERYATRRIGRAAGQWRAQYRSRF